MRKIIYGFTLVFLGIASVNAADAEQTAIQVAFNNYNQAVMAYQGAAAAKHVTQGTLDRYGHYRMLALTGSQDAIHKEPLSDQINILTVRHKIPLRELQAMNGAGLFAYTVDHQWTKREAVEVQTLGKVKVKGDRGEAPILVGGQNYGLKMGFVRENGLWKVDLPSLTDVASQGLKWAAWKKGMGEKEFVEDAMAKILGENLGEKLWIPLQVR